MRNNLLFALTIALSFLTHDLYAQSGDDLMRSNGKFYVVVGVIVSMFVGFLIYMVYIDKKLTKLENQIKDDE